MFSVFGWLRRAAAQAVVDGVRDGLAAVADDGEGGAPAPDLGELRKRLAAVVGGSEAKALPAATTSGAAASATVAEPTAAGAGESETAKVAGSRKKSA
jgi:hypothetical protein